MKRDIRSDLNMYGTWSVSLKLRFQICRIWYANVKVTTNENVNASCGPLHGPIGANVNLNVMFLHKFGARTTCYTLCMHLWICRWNPSLMETLHQVLDVGKARALLLLCFFFLIKSFQLERTQNSKERGDRERQK